MNGHSATTVDVYADIACPWCRLGTHQFHRAVAEGGFGSQVELVHRPFQLDPDAPAEPRPLLDVVTEMFGAEQLDTMVAAITDRGAEEGVVYRLDRAKAVNTFTAHRLAWLALHDHGPVVQNTVVTALFDTYFQDGGNVADPAELARLAEEAGIDGDRARAFLDSEEGTGEVREQLAAARRAGITTVPTFHFPDGKSISGMTGVADIRETLARTTG